MLAVMVDILAYAHEQYSLLLLERERALGFK